MELFEHQKQALERTKGRNRVAYYHDMGLGKTYTGAEKLHQLGSNTALVVCQKSKVGDWYEHFVTHYYLKLYPYDLTTKNGMKCFLEEVEEDDDHMGFIPNVGIINYDLLFRRPELLKLKNFTLMLDESSLIQNDTAKRTKFILKMNPSNVILLSGTPTSGKYENLLSQINLLGWNISKDTYDKQYINWTLTKDDGSGIRHKIVDKENPYKNVERLKMKMREHGCDFIKTEECFELPEQTFTTVNVKTSKDYWNFKSKCIVTLDDEIELVGDTTLTKMMYQRMLCGQYSKDKLDAFRDLVESTNDRLIVFYNFNVELDALKGIAVTLERPISEVNGSVKDLDAYDHEDNSITFIQYQAGAMGLNLQKANKIIYFTLPLMSELFEQSKKRIHRIGQTNVCFYYLMICKGSIEEQILETLEMRKDYTDELFKEQDIW